MHGHNHEQDVSVRHSDDLHSLLAVGEPRVDFFQTVRVFEGSNRIRKIHAVLAKVIGGFAIIPFVLHEWMVPDIGSGGKRRERSVPSWIWSIFGHEWRAWRALA